MDADDSNAQDEEVFIETLWRILQRIDAQHAQPAVEPCLLCHGSGICWQCRGNGRLIVPDYGLPQCRVCIGDGACVICHGTGERRHG